MFVTRYRQDSVWNAFILGRRARHIQLEKSSHQLILNEKGAGVKKVLKVIIYRLKK
jgi:hypothetical protein